MSPTFWRRIKLNCKFPKELTLHIKWTCIIGIYYRLTAYCQYHSCFVVGFHNSWCGIFLLVEYSYWWSIKMALCPWFMTCITCLSKCGIGDVFKRSFINFLYLFRMDEQGGGQITSYWWSIVCLWREIIHHIVPTLRCIFNIKLRWYWTLNWVNFVSNY